MNENKKILRRGIFSKTFLYTSLTAGDYRAEQCFQKCCPRTLATQDLLAEEQF